MCISTHPVPDTLYCAAALLPYIYLRLRVVTYAPHSYTCTQAARQTRGPKARNVNVSYWLTLIKLLIDQKNFYWIRFLYYFQHDFKHIYNSVASKCEKRSLKMCILTTYIVFFPQFCWWPSALHLVQSFEVCLCSLCSSSNRLRVICL